MREIHGIADAEKVQTVNEKGHYSVTVTDGHGLVVLLGCQTYPAALTPERARLVAKHLVESALRIEGKAREVQSR